MEFPRLFPVIPEEGLAALGDEALAALHDEFRAVSAQLRAGEIDLEAVFGDAYTNADAASAEAMRQWTEAAATVQEIRSILASHAEAVEEFDRQAAELDSQFATDEEEENEDDPSDPEDEDEVEEPSGEASAEADTPEDATPAEVEEPEAVTAGGTPAVRFPATGRRHAVPETPAGENPVALVAASGLSGARIQAGERLETMRDYAEKVIQVAKWRGPVKRSKGGTDERILIASADSVYPDERVLKHDDPEGNAEKIAAAGNYFLPEEKAIAAMTASGGICAPATPIYTLPDWETSERRVRGWLTPFLADRGAVSVPSVDTIADIGVGVGGDTGNAITVITADEDATGGTVATKSFQRVDCADWNEVAVTTIAHNREVGNLNSRTWPEGVAKANSLTMAALARTSEGFLLDRIDALSIAVDGGTFYGAASTLLYRLTLSRVGIISRLRLPEDTRFNLLLPFWAQQMVSMDVVAAGEDNRFDVPPGALTALLSEHGFNVTYHLDEGLAAGGTHDDEVFAAQAAGSQVDWPGSKMIARMAPAGTFILLDGGTLELGVVRDSSLNETNDYQLFGEEWLNVARIGPAEAAHRVEMTICPDGTIAPRAPSAFSCSAS